MPRSTLEPRDRELLEAPNFVHVSTLREDGSIHTIPIWVDTDGETVLLNTAEGRSWPKNLRRNGTVTLTVLNMENPYEYVTITGSVADDTHEGAEAHIDKMAKKYLDQDRYPYHQDGDQRVIFRIRPDRVHRHGS